jgi:hypothetical protein
MLEDDLRPFRQENLFHCVIARAHVDPTCINQSLTNPVQDAPLLKLNTDGIKHLANLSFTGGRHRIRALQLIKQERVNKLEKLERALKRDQEKMDDSSAPNSDLAKKETQIARLKQSISSLGIWGVILYEAGM